MNPRAIAKRLGAEKLMRALHSRIRMRHYGKVVTKMIDGVTYELDLSENIDSHLYFDGFYEKLTTEALNRYVTPDMIVMEVGANIGAHTLSIAQTLRHGNGKLYSFEPTNYAFGKLRRNLSLNDFQNVVIERIALSDVNQRQEIHRASTPETMPFKASWDKRSHGPKSQTTDEIQFVRLDDYVKENGINRMDFLKIDVDGYELRVIRGGLETLTTLRPTIIIELGTTLERVGDSVQDLIETIDGLGYDICDIETNVRYDESDLLNKVVECRTMDCLCIDRKRVGA